MKDSFSDLNFRPLGSLLIYEQANTNAIDINVFDFWKTFRIRCIFTLYYGTSERTPPVLNKARIRIMIFPGSFISRFATYSSNSSNLALDLKGYESISGQSKKSALRIVTHINVKHTYIRYVSVLTVCADLWLTLSVN